MTGFWLAVAAAAVLAVSAMIFGLAAAWWQSNHLENPESWTAVTIQATRDFLVFLLFWIALAIGGFFALLFAISAMCGTVMFAMAVFGVNP